MSDGLEVRVDFEEVQETGGESPGSTRARARRKASLAADFTAEHA